MVIVVVTGLIMMLLLFPQRLTVRGTILNLFLPRWRLDQSERSNKTYFFRPIHIYLHPFWISAAGPAPMHPSSSRCSHITLYLSKCACAYASGWHQHFCLEQVQLFFDCLPLSKPVNHGCGCLVHCSRRLSVPTSLLFIKFQISCEVQSFWNSSLTDTIYFSQSLEQFPLSFALQWH